MLATFRETTNSLQNLQYGRVIVKKTAGHALWYWSKYLILLITTAVVLGLAIVTYYTPQIGKLLDQNLPDVEVSIKNGKVTTTAPEPYMIGDEDFPIIINTKGEISDLDPYQNGALVLKDKFVVKSESETRIMDLKDVEDVTLNKPVVLGWINDNQPMIWILGVCLTLLAALLGGGLFWVWKLVSFLAWSVVLWLAAKLLRKAVTFNDAFKLVTYASVLPLFISFLSTFSQSSWLGGLSFAVFGFYCLAWVHNL